MIKNKNLFLVFLLSLLFFVSGACGLVYEIVWMRKLGLIFGNTTLAISTVLAAFMAGLGLGSFFFGRYVDRQKEPLRWYAWLEIGIGLFCLATPGIWSLVEWAYVSIYQTFHPDFWQFSIIRFVLCFCVLCVPTFFMGGTLPVMTRFVIRDCRQTAKTVGLLYGLNTLGACAGVLFASFYAIYFFGLKETIFITAGMNIAVGLGALLILRFQKYGDDVPDERSCVLQENDAIIEPLDPGLASEKHLAKLLLLVFALSGFTSMAYELCWTKVLALCIGSSVYSFAIMLASFLIGLALGSLLIAAVASRIRINYFLVGLIQVVVALLVIWGVGIFDQMPFYFLQLFSVFKSHLGLFQFAKFLLASCVILPPTIFIGCTFAMVAQILNRSVDTTGQTIGRAYLINTLGCILGSVVAGFVLVPWLGIFKTLVIMVILNFFVGLVLLALSKKTWRKHQIIGVGALVGLTILMLVSARPWSKGLLTTNIAIDPQTYLNHSKFEILSSISQNELLYYKEGLSSTVAVKRHQEVISLSINANIDASSGSDMYTQLLLGHLPSLFAKRHERALVIGMGSGVTLAALASYPYREISCVELEKGVVTAAGFFAKENRQALDDPRVKSIVNDGRNHLLVENVQYDVIISEPSSPWMAGVANLFTLEQFRLMKKRLAADGVVCQWLNTYSMSPANIRMIIKTFRSVFPHASLWQTIGADLLLVGSNQGIVYDILAIDQEIKANALLRKDLSAFKVFDAAGLLSCFMLTDEELEKMSSDAPVNSDNLPLLEYSAPLNLYGYEQVVSKNLEMINTYRTARYPLMIHAPETSSKRVAFHNAIARAALEKSDVRTASFEIALSNTEQALNPGSVLNYGILQFTMQRIPEAITSFENYLVQDPDSTDAQLFLARAYVITGEIDKAIVFAAQATHAAGNNYDYLMTYAQALAQKGEAGKAVEIVQKAIEIKGMTFSRGLLLSNLLLASGQAEKAVAALEHLISIYPHSFGGYEALARIFESVGAMPEAIKTYQRALDFIPFDARVYYALSLLYEKVKDARNARLMAKRFAYYQNAPKIGASRPSAK